MVFVLDGHRKPLMPWTSGSFDPSVHGRRIVQGISYQYCRMVQRNGGWTYDQKPVPA